MSMGDMAISWIFDLKLLSKKGQTEHGIYINYYRSCYTQNSNSFKSFVVPICCTMWDGAVSGGRFHPFLNFPLKFKITNKTSGHESPSFRGRANYRLWGCSSTFGGYRLFNTFFNSFCARKQHAHHGYRHRSSHPPCHRERWEWGVEKRGFCGTSLTRCA